MPRVAKAVSTTTESTKAAVRRKASDEEIDPQEGSSVPSAKKSRLSILPIPEISRITGNLLVCGQGDMGQLGLGEDDTEKKRPALVSSVKDVVEVCAGGMHNLCLTKDGEVYSFGCNDEGALGRDSSEEGSEFTPAKVDLPGKAVQISAGDSHSACLLEDGRVFAWGSFRDSHGNMGLTLQGNKRSPIHLVPEKKHCQIASGADHLVMLTTEGHVYTVGCAEQGQLGRIAMRSASGDSRRGKTQILQPDVLRMRRKKKIEKIWATTYCTFAREVDSDVILGFGLNNYKQLGIQKDIQLVSTPVVIDNFKNVKKIAGGQHHTLVLTTDNKCYSIGRHDYGRLGLGKLNEDVTELKLVKSLKNIVDVACGEATSFALDADGKLYSWGMGSNLQLGTGEEDDVGEPMCIESKQTQGKELIRASGGGQHSIFLVKNETNNNVPAVSKKPAAVTTLAKGKGKEKEAIKENGSTDIQPEPIQNDEKVENAEAKDENDVEMKTEKQQPEKKKGKGGRGKK